jgi:hypothetical protein
MAEKIVIQLDLEKGDFSKASGTIETEAGKIGKKAALSFQKNFDTGLSDSFKNIGKLALKATTLVGGLATAFLGFKSIDAAQSQEDAINSLNAALSRSKNASIQASEGIQALATELQNATRFEDDVILRNAALIQSLADLDEKGLKRATKAALDLSTVLRVDLDTASNMIGKAASGNVEIFGKYGLAIEKGKTNAESFANALNKIEQRFGGAAIADVNTYSGSVDQLKNSFGDLLEEVGNLIVKNPKFVGVIKEVTKFIQEAVVQFSDFAKSFDLFDVLTANLLKVNEAIITFVIAPLEQLYNVGKLVADGIIAGLSRVVSGLGNVGFAIATLLEKLNIGESLSQGLRDFEETSELVAKNSSDNLKNSFDKIADFNLSASLMEKNEQLRTFFSEQSTIIAENAAINQQINDSANIAAQESLLTWGEVFKSVFDEVGNGSMTLQDQIKQANENMKKFARESSAALRDGLARGAGQAFAAFGKAIATGEDALGSFAKALFKSIADQAVALGTNFILTGTAMLFSPNPKDQAQAPFLIKSGAALAAFGGFLGGLAGGGGAGGAGGGTQGNTGIGEGNIPVTNEIASPDTNQERLQPSTNVQVVVQGSLVQQEELGDFITRTLNESFGKQGVTLTDARFV